MKTLRIGIASPAEMKSRTLAVARGELTPGPDEPKLWFASIESLARVLSDKNRLLLDLIIEQQPNSLAELEALSGRAKSNLSRTLKSMERFGLVELLKGADGTLKPHVPYEEIKLALPIGQHHNAPAAGNLNGDTLTAAMQASPHRDIEIEPQRAAMPVREVVL
jgi:predicted transcriptional regulator